MNTSIAKEIVSNSIKEAIAIVGTQSALAEKVGVTQGAIGKYLRKEAIPKASTARKLSKAVNGNLKPFHFSPIECEE